MRSGVERSLFLVLGSWFLVWKSRGWFMKSVAKDREQVETATPAFAVMDRILESDIEWLWPGRMVLDNLTLLIGDPDVGKSLVALDLAARLSRGGIWPDGAENGRPSGVVLMQAEDHLRYTVSPALLAAKADMKRIISLYELQVYEGAKRVTRPVDLKRDLKVLEEAIKFARDCRLVVIDPITAFLGQGGGARRALMELMTLAQNWHVAVLGVAHLRSGGKQAMHRTMGGLPLLTAARAVWMVARDPACDERRLLLPVKNNLVRERGGLQFVLKAREGEMVPRVKWLKEEPKETADEVLWKLQKRSGKEPSACDEAIEFVMELLADGPRLVKEVEKEAKERGISLVSVRRGRRVLELRPYREQIPGPWWIRLPPVAQREEKCKQVSEKLDCVERLAKNTGDLNAFEEDGRDRVERLGDEETMAGNPESQETNHKQVTDSKSEED
jgi:putative DNA primase/helicase